MMTHSPIKTTQSQSTCDQCPHFQDFNEPNGRGWCNLFDRTARKHHPRTHDCSHTDESSLDLPHSDFEIHAIVKVIDEHEHHSEWAEFIIVAKKLNTKLYRSIDSYLNEPLWYYQLAAIGHKQEAGGKGAGSKGEASSPLLCTKNGSQSPTPLSGLHSGGVQSPSKCPPVSPAPLPLFKPAFSPFWVAENEICHSDQSYLIDTEDIF